MTHLGYVASSYALGIGVPLVLAILAAYRLARARRMLAAIDPREANRSMSPS